MFGKKWFEKHQKILKWFVNTFIGRWFFKIHGNRSSVGKNKITRIGPNYIGWDGYKVESSNGFNTKQPHFLEFRTHNKFTKRLYYGLLPVWYLFHAWDWLIAQEWSIKPAFKPSWDLGFSTLTVYPDADAESTSVDGLVRGENAVYATANTAGSSAVDAITETALWHGLNGGTYYIDRFFYLFDTSDLTANVSVSDADFSVYKRASIIADTHSDSMCLVISDPASNTALGTADFTTLGTDALVTSDFGDAPTDNYWAFNNINDLSVISKTGITKLGLRTLNDINDSVPTGDNYVGGLGFADIAGTDNDPKLVVTYTILKFVPKIMFI